MMFCLQRKSSKEQSSRQTVSQSPFIYSLNNFDEFVSVQERLDIRCKDHIKTTRDVADPKRRLLQFDVQEFCDNFEKGMMKALNDISKNQKKSTSTRAPVAEPSLFISTKSKGKSETHVEELKDFSDSLPTFDEYDEEPIESLMICEKNCDFPSLESEFMNDTEQIIVELTVLQAEHPSPIFDEEDEPDPVFDEEATSITSIIMESHLCFDPDTTPVHLTPDLQEHLFVLSIQERQVQPLRNESIDCAQQPEIWRSFVVQTGYLGDASDMGSVKNGYLNIQKVFCHESNFPGKPTNQGFTEAWNHLNIFTEE
ncbi:hypothetical protein F2Q69_00048821 [Brassica cretica]|uniref:Uncharacterized protein n=1 Tax=Brassica cretica TaxID=69181 RepID=A0A8S9PQD5_BRACR|nr:hypothetical protein F2Q69_00048821 [Brassica cretica]